MDIDGADQLAALARRLKEMGDKGLQRELSKAIREAVAPFRVAVRESAMEKLPSRGGLNQRVADQAVPRIRRAASSRASGLRLVAKGKRGMSGLQRIDEGSVRHPVFGADKTAWVTQAVTPRFWSDPADRMGPEIRRKIEAAMDAVAAKIGG